MKKAHPRSVGEQNRHIGLALRAARLKASMSQIALGQAAMLDERTIRRAEKGEGQSPETLRAIAAVLSLDLPRLIEEARRQDPPIAQALVVLAGRQLRKLLWIVLALTAFPSLFIYFDAPLTPLHELLAAHRMQAIANAAAPGAATADDGVALVFTVIQLYMRVCFLTTGLIFSCLLMLRVPDTPENRVYERVLSALFAAGSRRVSRLRMGR